MGKWVEGGRREGGKMGGEGCLVLWLEPWLGMGRDGAECRWAEFSYDVRHPGSG